MEEELKQRSIIEKTRDNLLDMAAAVEQLEGIVPETAYFTISLPGDVNIWPDSEDAARKIVGALIRKIGAKPTINKWGTMELEAIFNHSGITFHVNKYRGRKCAIVKREIVHEAKPEEIIPAKEAWVETVEELVCEMPSVESEV